MSKRAKMPQSDFKPQLVGLIGINPFFNSNSASRLQMASGNFGQALTVDCSTPNSTQTGMEQELGKFTFSIKMPCNANILAVIQKYPQLPGANTSRVNPLTLVVYEDMDSPELEIGIIELPMFHWIHQSYGFQYKYKPAAVNQLFPGGTLQKDTIIADSPNVSDNGDYSLGTDINVAMMSIPEIIEDGIVISESLRDSMTSKGYGIRAVNCGKSRYPLNITGNGTTDKPKAFPDIGEAIRPDGLLFALREYDEYLCVNEMTPWGISTPDYGYDRKTYAEGGERVIDINVYKGSPQNTYVPMQLAEQLENYHGRLQQFYRKVLEVYEAIKVDRYRKNIPLHISPLFHQWVIRAMAFCNDCTDGPMMFTRENDPLDEWRVEITFDYTVKPGIGSKLTDFNGSKGVVVAIWPDDRMPVDKWGNRADIIVADISTIARMNTGRVIEQYIKASNDYVHRNILQMRDRDVPIKEQWEFLTRHYQTISPKMMDIVNRVKLNPTSHLNHVAKHGISLYTPTDTPVSYSEVIYLLDKFYPDMIGPVTYKDENGRTMVTKSDVLIGKTYMLMLEKTGNTVAGVAAGRLQHFGILARLTKEDKYSYPGKPQSVKIIGETEARAIAAYVGGPEIADLLGQSNDPVVMKEEIRSIIMAENPAFIQRTVDRSKFPMGNARIHVLGNHILECYGVRFVRRNTGVNWNEDN